MLMNRPLRVLSLFDGISTALHILTDVLHLQIEMYFSSEIDTDALQLQTHKYSGKIVQLGDAKKLDPGENDDNYALLNSLGRIDLLVGGPPCGDTSRVNPNRKGLSMELEATPARDMQQDRLIFFCLHVLAGEGSSGQLIYTYVRIRNALEEKARKNKLPFLWFAEHTAKLDTTVKDDIVR